VAVLVAFSGHDRNLTARTAGIALVGTGLVLATLLAFYAVGLSEDRDRERSASADADPPPDPHPTPKRRRIAPHRPPPRRRGHE
jgi:hypothetical protein